MNGSCCSCGVPTAPVLDLGTHRLPDFTPPGAPPPPAYPLALMLCPVCTLLQLDDLTPREALYHGRYGFRSGVNEAIRADLAGVALYALNAARVRPDPAWLDIACNDGTLLSHVPDTWTRAGIDPLAHLAGEARRHADRVISDYFRPGHFGPGMFDVITSVSVFYDLPDPCGFARDVASVLAPGGVWVIQQNYAADMITSNAVDNICHEHVTYFTVRSLFPVLAAAGLEICDVTYSPVNGGCFRVLAARRGERRVQHSVRAALEREQDLALHEPGTWQSWGLRAGAELGKTRDWLEEQKAAGRRVYLYGASTRGGTILQAIGAGPELLPYAVERQPAKWGTVMAATGIPVISEEQMRADPPDALLVSPWFFRDIFTAREKAFLAAGGAMAFPLPAFEVVAG